MDKGLVLFRKMTGIFFFAMGLAFLLTQEAILNTMMKGLELEIIWRYLVDSGY